MSWSSLYTRVLTSLCFLRVRRMQARLDRLDAHILRMKNEYHDPELKRTQIEWSLLRRRMESHASDKGVTSEKMHRTLSQCLLQQDAINCKNKENNLK